MSGTDPSARFLARGQSRPLLADALPGRVIAWQGPRPVTVAHFLADVAGLAAGLPTARAAVNLCEDRYAFMVAFAALLVRGQANLLPPSRTRQAVAEALAAHPDSYAVGDAELAPAPPRYVRFVPNGKAGIVVTAPIAADATAAINYTSGSTGVPHAHARHWGGFAVASRYTDRLLRRVAGGAYQILATVPPQHMYGLEFSVLLPLFGYGAVYAGRPLFAGDIVDGLRQLPPPRVLVTTPVHLRALLAAGPALPALAAIVSSTAPLARELARAAEARFGGPLLEVFGSTETGVIAHRRTAAEEAWTLRRGVALGPQPDGTRIEARQLARPVVLADVVELLPGRRFRLRGRNTDMLEVAGKRASLSDLTHKLLAIPGVRDGAVFQLDAADAMGVRRIAALVVAPAVSAEAILEALRVSIDPVFLPRPLQRVAALPRSDTGKLPRAALLDMLKRDRSP